MSNFKVLVLFYSFTGCTAKLAEFIAEGASVIEGAQVEVKQVPESLPKEFFYNNPDLQTAKESFARIPVASIEDLTSADGVAFGSPVHFGSFASQLKQFIDQLSPVFIKGSMVGKPAAFFTSSGSLHGGEEATLISMMIPMLNLGMLPVGVPYPIQGEGPEFDAGSPYGSIYICGHKGEKDLSDGDKKVARILGQRLAAITKIMKNGSEMYEDCKFLTKNHEAR
ncbi:NAD(P)H:quinone oxidoreductase, type IV [Candidatus Daviesbacteria bacterium RIFCSPLOWO2_02_FULL_40_8]|uniref:NAD(P)H:quinone oxidoreductase, type IV n=1 Tax=Candidatus Daviesbacteria bacterium RIFCSPLOWO2_01_FULL_40_24 TaxID=1797787 RepID=A0A1F5MIE5_9BACT|nr:MAG: NAD(P)H:quinone oxidoreductase, type IV [Candidatus Daviesbacteria bacterium RIFCSPHIGHO2_01_FULL_41_45]OGE34173.1 MAG: NAD(P)H:quinone oxidoreductase, type IV [Candidatus Daviesbacteria bacterium RIFCSPHIGHO2_02_FULL_41_14]OGE65157.1 MAG: NAD(P)H:quinone oxidoreductase, type IV [Candidatus Daviesbacteria bacterium RIFCSPLOWO2_01_FULL_40_24]OGE66860.1 MAG: NAD(P)H:quinone oxidoreductase, type IV [Candidatus Daviesbacteria bacterium RIFCSPLOWO2_02_FULL_40_8]